MKKEKRTMQNTAQAVISDEKLQEIRRLEDQKLKIDERLKKLKSDDYDAGGQPLAVPPTEMCTTFGGLKRGNKKKK